MPCDNYITRVLLQSDTAGHYRALGDQVNMTFKAGSTDTFCRKRQGAHQDSSIKKYVKYKVSAFKLEFFIEVKNGSVYHVRDNVASELFMINACSPGGFAKSRPAVQQPAAHGPPRPATARHGPPRPSGPNVRRPGSQRPATMAAHKGHAAN